MINFYKLVFYRSMGFWVLHAVALAGPDQITASSLATGRMVPIPSHRFPSCSLPDCQHLYSIFTAPCLPAPPVLLSEVTFHLLPPGCAHQDLHCCPHSLIAWSFFKPDSPAVLNAMPVFFTKWVSIMALFIYGCYPVFLTASSHTTIDIIVSRTPHAPCPLHPLRREAIPLQIHTLCLVSLLLLQSLNVS